MLEALREQVWKLHLELPKNDLVSWTGGNVSGRDPETGLVVIKPSGVKYPDLRPEQLVVLGCEWQDRRGQSFAVVGYGQPSIHLSPAA